VGSEIDLGKALLVAGKSLVKGEPRMAARAQATRGKAKARAQATRKPKELKPCECGCGKKGAGRFRPGHDAILKSRLFNAVRSGGAGADKAKAEVKRLGWSHLMAK
jgi:hypothetical protein